MDEESIYLGEGSARVPLYAIRVVVDISVMVIPAGAFLYHTKLMDVELPALLCDIGRNSFGSCVALKRIQIPTNVLSIQTYAFAYCQKLVEVNLPPFLEAIEGYTFFKCHSLELIDIPLTITVIGSSAFFEAKLLSICLPDTLEEIESYAFYCNSLSTIRIPTRVTKLSRGVFGYCKSLFSVEISGYVTKLECDAFLGCLSLRNVVLSPDTIVDRDVFADCVDLMDVYDAEPMVIINALKLRFHDLPLHKMLYYQSFLAVSNDALEKAALKSNCKQDCLGMTPLHILTCSSLYHDLKLYRIMIETYPKQLITKDKWGALPLLYAIWGEMPTEVIQLLLESYQQYFPDYKFEWTDMVETLARAIVPHDRIAKLVHVNTTNFPDQRIDWDDLLDKLAQRASSDDHLGRFGEMFQYLVMCGTSERVKAIGLPQWRDGITNMIATQSINSDGGLAYYLTKIKSELIHLEQEYFALTMSTTLLELPLWKKKLNEDGCQMETTMTKLDKSSDFRQYCRVICGSDIVVECVLPFLIQVYD